MADRKIRPVILGLRRRTTKPPGMSQKEWDSYAEARRISREQANKPHPFARAHYRLEQSRRKRERERKKKGLRED